MRTKTGKSFFVMEKKSVKKAMTSFVTRISMNPVHRI